MLLGDFTRRLDEFERMMEQKMDRIIALLEVAITRLDEGALDEIDLRGPRSARRGSVRGNGRGRTIPPG